MTRHGRRCAAGLALALALCAPRAHAEGHAARLTVDNDHFNFWEAPGMRPDFGYTHGIEVRLHFPETPSALAGIGRWSLGRDAGESVAFEFLARQAIYSPWVLPPDRPYAGWLELGAGFSRADAGGSSERLLHVGITGPPSLGEATQRYFHRRFDHGEEPDWTGQLPTEPGIGIELQDTRWLPPVGGPGGWLARFGGFSRVRAGTYAIDLRLGLSGSLGLRPPAAWPAAAPPGPSLYLRLAPKIDLVARDEFLDGPLFRSDGERSETERIVPESEATIGAGWGHARLEWTVYRRGREFEGQPKPHTYAALQFAWLP